MKNAGRAIPSGVFLLFFAILFIGPVNAEDDPVREQALAGNKTAQFRLGNEYFYGTKTRKANYTLAAYWFHRAADQGIPEAVFNYGLCLEQGLGVDRDPFQAADCFRKAAESGFAPAQYNHALNLLYGITCRSDADRKKAPPGYVDMQDAKKGLELLEKLSGQGMTQAKIELAEYLIRNQRSDPETRNKIFRLLDEVRTSGELNARSWQLLADCYYGGIGTAPSSEKMIAALKMSVQLGSVEGMGKLAHCYEYGISVKQDSKLAFQYYKKAALGGLPLAQFKYAEFIATGAEENAGMDEALKWYRKSAENDCPQALFKLAVLHREGISVEKDPRKSAEYFFRAAKLGYARAQYDLACLYIDPDSPLTKDATAAFYWFQEAAKRGDAPAMRRLAVCFFNGEGCAKDQLKGLYWLQKAAEKGDIAAMRMLEQVSGK